jgi:glycosyltransferase involved in cell wall biosynthesis
VIRLLFLTESFHPILGGGEQHIRRLAGALAKEGFPCTVLTRRASLDLPAEEYFEGIRVLRVLPAGPGRPGKYRMVPRVVRALYRERKTFDILVVRGTRVLGLPGLLCARALGKRLVLQPELNGEFSGDVYTFGTRLDRGLGRLAVRAMNGVRKGALLDADRVVAMSQAIQRECLAAGFSDERVALIPHGVSIGSFCPADPEERLRLRRVLGLPESAVIVVYSGRLLKGKGLETLLEAFAGISEPFAHLLFVGSGEGQALSVEDALKDDVRKRGLGNRVTFAGRRENVSDYLRASDLFAFPSVFEALGIALVEAQASGLPAVGSRTGGIVDVIEPNETGLLVPPGDVQALQEALESLIRDPERRAELGARARARTASRFSEDLSLLRYRTLFQEIASGASRT